MYLSEHLKPALNARAKKDDKISSIVKAEIRERFQGRTAESFPSQTMKIDLNALIHSIKPTRLSEITIYKGF